MVPNLILYSLFALTAICVADTVNMCDDYLPKLVTSKHRVSYELFDWHPTLFRYRKTWTDTTCYQNNCFQPRGPHELQGLPFSIHPNAPDHHVYWYIFFHIPSTGGRALEDHFRYFFLAEQLRLNDTCDPGKKKGYANHQGAILCPYLPLHFNMMGNEQISHAQLHYLSIVTSTSAAKGMHLFTPGHVSVGHFCTNVISQFRNQKNSVGFRSFTILREPLSRVYSFIFAHILTDKEKRVSFIDCRKNKSLDDCLKSMTTTVVYNELFNGMTFRLGDSVSPDIIDFTKTNVTQIFERAKDNLLNHMSYGFISGLQNFGDEILNIMKDKRPWPFKSVTNDSVTLRQGLTSNTQYYKSCNNGTSAKDCVNALLSKEDKQMIKSWNLYDLELYRIAFQKAK